MKHPTFLRKCIVLMATALLAIPAMAQEDALRDLPGYVDFGDLQGLFGEPSVQVAVGKSLLGLVGALSKEDDPETAEMLGKLSGVRVNVFENREIPDNGKDLVMEISGRLQEKGWESVVSVNEPEEQVRIFMKLNGDKVQGITVMALEEDEAVFVNIIGDINPTDLDKVMDRFDVDIDD